MTSKLLMCAAVVFATLLVPRPLHGFLSPKLLMQPGCGHTVFIKLTTKQASLSAPRRFFSWKASQEQHISASASGHQHGLFESEKNNAVASTSSPSSAKRLNSTITNKTKFHPRYAFRGNYDMEKLAKIHPKLQPFLRAGHPASKAKSAQSSHNRRPANITIDFSDPLAVRALNAALLSADYGVSQWDDIVPASSLCPPVPGRADYIHTIADVLWQSATSSSDDDATVISPTIPKGPSIRGLDVGTGATLIYPLIGTQTYGWSFIASDVDAISIQSASQIAAANGLLDDGRIDIRTQENTRHTLRGILSKDEKIDFVMCNPPFYESAEAYQKENDRKVRNLAANARKRGAGIHNSNNNKGRRNKSEDTRGARTSTSIRSSGDSAAAPVGSNNFGGSASELWYPGGEMAFISNLIKESRCPLLSKQCLWFSSLVSRRDNLPALCKMLRLEEDSHNANAKGGDNAKSIKVKQTRIVEMGQGQKTSRIMFWSFYDQEAQLEWFRSKSDEQIHR
jgi:23S rRNA (adenine1618-N6)-methyltransferase